mmetsp:Transcript_23368/g.55639  ORF Transcript_23368/g.55639 Transcript_23368/m.55639 type:complete len:487 (+) Transcript_23368:1431-2891(+)
MHDRIGCKSPPSILLAGTEQVAPSPTGGRCDRRAEQDGFQDIPVHPEVDNERSNNFAWWHRASEHLLGVRDDRSSSVGSRRERDERSRVCEPQDSVHRRSLELENAVFLDPAGLEGGNVRSVQANSVIIENDQWLGIFQDPSECLVHGIRASEPDVLALGEDGSTALACVVVGEIDENGSRLLVGAERALRFILGVGGVGGRPAVGLVNGASVAVLSPVPLERETQHAASAVHINEVECREESRRVEQSRVVVEHGSWQERHVSGRAQAPGLRCTDRAVRAVEHQTIVVDADAPRSVASRRGGGLATGRVTLAVAINRATHHPSRHRTRGLVNQAPVDVSVEGRALAAGREHMRALRPSPVALGDGTFLMADVISLHFVGADAAVASLCVAIRHERPVGVEDLELREAVTAVPVAGAAEALDVADLVTAGAIALKGATFGLKLERTDALEIAASTVQFRSVVGNEEMVIPSNSDETILSGVHTTTD